MNMRVKTEQRLGFADLEVDLADTDVVKLFSTTQLRSIL